MSSKINSFCYFKLNPNTINDVRKEYNLHTYGAMDQAIDILHDWIQKQPHFMKKDLPREYLERCIINAKGSLEKAKRRLNNLYTMQTMTPILFEKCHAIKDFPNLRNFFVNVPMPNMSEDNCRIHIGKFMTKTVTAAGCLEAYQHCRIILECAKLYDYAKGYHVIYDLSEVSVADLLSNIDWVVFRTCLTAVIEAYGFRLSTINIITSSTMVNMLIKFIKQFVSEKIGSRIHAVKDVESLQEHVSKKMLPKDYGGEQKSILELYDVMNEAFSTEENVAFLEEMKRAHIIEELRCSDNNLDTELLGIPGSFKLLNVD
ncbi:uncharacterized protein LOC125236557 isoform X1 [Leguminivora glycinivorella]|uniref:uncharacterized protein LOC125236557 isoform X1 n=1 Tax=Leguminivora glycinivorella TaxID=1035111 RepID=UPI00200BFC3A|nr:uncharacterized protein LOC125236557 isoform X1 [Leguminivora glycinivorella]